MQYRNPFTGHVRRSRNRAQSLWEIQDSGRHGQPVNYGAIVDATLMDIARATIKRHDAENAQRITPDRPRMSGPVANLIHGRQPWKGGAK